MIDIIWQAVFIKVQLPSIILFTNLWKFKCIKISTFVLELFYLFFLLDNCSTKMEVSTIVVLSSNNSYSKCWFELKPLCGGKKLLLFPLVLMLGNFDPWLLYCLYVIQRKIIIFLFFKKKMILKMFDVIAWIWFYVCC